MSSNAFDIKVGSRVLVADWLGSEEEGTVTQVGTTRDGLQMEYTVRVIHGSEEEDVFDAEHTRLDDDPTLVDTHDAAQLRDEIRYIMASDSGLGNPHPLGRARAAIKVSMLANQLAWEEITELALAEVERLEQS